MFQIQPHGHNSIREEFGASLLINFRKGKFTFVHGFAVHKNKIHEILRGVLLDI